LVLIENTTLICPKNDLESQTIVNIAMRLGMDVRVSEQGWGAMLGMEPPEVFQNSIISPSYAISPINPLIFIP